MRPVHRSGGCFGSASLLPSVQGGLANWQSLPNVRQSPGTAAYASDAAHALDLGQEYWLAWPGTSNRLEDIMRGVVFPGDRTVETMSFPDPTPGPGEVVLEMKA